MDKNIAKDLTKLINLQDIDTQLDDIIKLRGSLPQEVVDLEEEGAKLQAHLLATEEQLVTLEKTIADNKAMIKQKEALVQKYEAQQMDVRNNREYDAITKEIDLNKLDVQLAEKKIEASYKLITENQNLLATIKTDIQQKEAELVSKKEDLTKIIASREVDEQLLNKKREKLVGGLGDIKKLYQTIRESMPNKVAVVTLKRDACGGCCILIPPQTKMVIQAQNKINTCEYCGRIIADIEEEIVEA